MLDDWGQTQDSDQSRWEMDWETGDEQSVFRLRYMSVAGQHLQALWTCWLWGRTANSRKMPVLCILLVIYVPKKPSIVRHVSRSSCLLVYLPFDACKACFGLVG